VKFQTVDDDEITYRHKEMWFHGVEKDGLNGTFDFFEWGLRMSFRDLVNPYTSLGTSSGWQTINIVLASSLIEGQLTNTSNIIPSAVPTKVRWCSR